MESSAPNPASDSVGARDLALRVVRRLRDAGHSAYFVGGCVRDALLGLDPQDYDVATLARPEAISACFPDALGVGAAFGVMLVRQGGATVEVATFRGDGEYTDHRRPDSVRFTDAAQDAARRDFTINGLFLDPLHPSADTDPASAVIDHVGGVDDLRAGVVRAIGDPARRFGEDALRLLRAPRFAAGLGFEIAPDTLAAIRRAAHDIAHVSAERVRDELFKGLTRPHPGRFLQLLSDTGLLTLILPEAAAMVGCEQTPDFHPEGDVFVHTKMVLSHLPPGPSPALAFAALLHDVGKPPTATRDPDGRIRFNGHAAVGAVMTDAIARRLMLSNADREHAVTLVKRHMDFINLPAMAEKTIRRFLAADTIDDELLLHRADCLGSNGNLANFDLANRRLAEFRAPGAQPAVPPPLVRGDDLISAGLKPGPAFATLLRAIQDAQLEGRVSDRPEALALLMRLIEEQDAGGSGGVPMSDMDNPDPAIVV